MKKGPLHAVKLDGLPLKGAHCPGNAETEGDGQAEALPVGVPLIRREACKHSGACAERGRDHGLRGDGCDKPQQVADDTAAEGDAYDSAADDRQNKQNRTEHGSFLWKTRGNDEF